jgi:hypothetical protein
MNDPFLVVALVMSGIVGGSVAWKYATWNLYRRPGAEWATDEIAPERINRRLLARRKRQRLQMTLTAAVISPVLIYALLVGIGIAMELSHTR